MITFDNLRKIMNDLSINLKESYVEYLIFKMKFMTQDESSEENLLEALNFHALLDFVRNPTGKVTLEEESSLEEDDLKENLNFDNLEYISNKKSSLSSIPKINNYTLNETNIQENLILDKLTVNQINNLNKSPSTKEDFKITKEEFNLTIEKIFKQIARSISFKKLGKSDLTKYFSNKSNQYNISISSIALIVFMKEKLEIKLDLITQYCIALMIKFDYPDGLYLDDLVLELSKFDLISDNK